MQAKRAAEGEPKMREISQKSEKTEMKHDKQVRDEESRGCPDGHAAVYLLKFELQGTEDAKEILKQFGRMKDGIIREVYVPGAMTLHAMHYMIQRLFGWQNEHLHGFSLTESDFEMVTGNRMSRYTSLCGALFRFPEDGVSDQTWDDDYEAGVPLAKWFRQKYSAPYRDLSVGDTFSENQRKAKVYGHHEDDLKSTQGFIGDGQANRLLESLTVDSLFLCGQRGDFEEWQCDTAEKVARQKAHRQPASWERARK